MIPQTLHHGLQSAIIHVCINSGYWTNAFDVPIQNVCEHLRQDASTYLDTPWALIILRPDPIECQETQETSYRRMTSNNCIVVSEYEVPALSGCTQIFASATYEEHALASPLKCGL